MKIEQQCATTERFMKSLLHNGSMAHNTSTYPARRPINLAPDSVQTAGKEITTKKQTGKKTSQHEQISASAPNRLPALSEAVGPSVRGFMLCIAARPVRKVPTCVLARSFSRVRHMVEVRPKPLQKNRERQMMVKREREVRLVQTNGLAHRRLDVERLDVLPVLLEQGDEEVDALRKRGEHHPNAHVRAYTYSA